MKLNLRQQITQFAHVLQSSLFPTLQDELGKLTGPAKRLVATLEMIPLARFVPCGRGMGWPSFERPAGHRQRFRGQGYLRICHHASSAGRTGQ